MPAIEVLGVLIALFGLATFFLAFFLPILVILNVGGIRRFLLREASRLPGFRSGSKWKATLGTFGYLLLAALIITSIGALLIGPVEDHVEISETSISDEEIFAGSSTEITGLITNTGNESQTVKIDLIVEGEVRASDEITLGSGQSRGVSFDTTFDQPGEYRIELEDVEVGTVVVRDSITINNISLSDQEIPTGETAEVIGYVENVGPHADTATFELVVNNEVMDSKEMTIPPGETARVRFSIMFDEEGEYDIRLNEIFIGNLSVVEVEPAEFEIIDSQLSDTDIVRGDSVEIRSSITNIGGTEGKENVQLTSNGDVIHESDLVLSPGEEFQFTHSYIFYESGEYDIEINGKGLGTVTVSGSSDEEIFSGMKNTLWLSGIDVDEIKRNENELFLNYSVDDPNTAFEDTYFGIVIISGVYAGALDQGLPTDRVIVTIDATEIDQGYLQYRIETEWIMMLDNGDIDENEVVSRAINTLEEL